jgi:putative nucleotidyltransferase with HDIG domain
MDKLTEAILDNLDQAGVLPKKEIDRILDQLKSGFSSLEDLLLQSGASKTSLLKAKASAFGGIDWIDFDAFQPELEMVKLIPRATASRYNLLCIGKREGKLVVAASHPDDAFGLEYVQMITGSEIIPVVALDSDLKAQIDTAYPDKKQVVGISAKEAVEEKKLEEVGKKRFISLDFHEGKRPEAKTAVSIFEITRQLSETLDIDQLLLKVMDAVEALCNSEASSVLLYDETLHVLYFKCASGEKGELLKQVVLPVSEDSIAGWVALHREPVIVNDMTGENRHYKGIDQLLKFKTRNLICIPIVSNGKLFGVLEAVNKKGEIFSEEDKAYLNLLAGQTGVCLANAQLVDELQDYFSSSLEILIGAVESLDPGFKGHVSSVYKIALSLAKDAGISGKTYSAIAHASLLHDIGKLKLSGLPEEEVKKQHPLVGANMTKEIKILKDVAPIISKHHEKWDGSGFPEGLKGEEIPLPARILSLAENFVEWGEKTEWKIPAADFISKEGGTYDPRLLGSLEKIVKNFPGFQIVL